MAKRRKPSTRVPSRRSTRRGKQGDGANASEGEPSASAEPIPEMSTKNKEPPDGESEENQPTAKALQTPDITTLQTAQLNLVPVVALHKKFGKYRCLLSNDRLKKYEGSDSETNSSVEIRVTDPNCGSESDSNVMDNNSDTNSGACPSPLNLQGNSREISPVRSQKESVISLLQKELQTVSDDLKDIIDKADTTQNSSSIEQPLEQTEISTNMTNNFQDQVINLIESDKKSNIPDQVDEQRELTVEEHLEYKYNDDDEVITIVQIVEDDNQELYYEIIESPTQLSQQDETSAKEECKDVDFQKDFAKLNLQVESNPNSPMECTDFIDLRTPPCNTPDPQNSSEILVRPDPSLTPISILSDDSNSSRATEQNQNNSNDSAESSPTGVRRSNRIKTISTLKQKTKGFGLVKTPLKKALITQTKLKLEELGSDSQDKSCDGLQGNTNTLPFPVPTEMPVKVKSRWRRSSELEMGANSPLNSPLASPSLPSKLPLIKEENKLLEDEKSITPLCKEAYDKIIEERMSQYIHLEENEYWCDRMISKETKKMICDCFLTRDEVERGELACGEDCLNRLLMIECNSRCPVGDRCTNRRFQKRQNGPLKVFYADKKGCGVEASADIPPLCGVGFSCPLMTPYLQRTKIKLEKRQKYGEFLMEYVGEVLGYEQFYKRAQAYSEDNNLHHYFMSLKGDTVIDATLKGNISRFINHSCEPNAETQKWTVNGELRIGFFSKRDIAVGEEITFDYQFQRFGRI